VQSQRREIRSIVTVQPKGLLQVLLGDQSIDVHTVKDVSPTGLRLELGHQIKIGSNILVRYVTEKVDLKLNGTVVWNSSSVDETQSVDETEEMVTTDTFLVGIRLASPSILQTFW
jgi:hypothetical protein